MPQCDRNCCSAIDVMKGRRKGRLHGRARLELIHDHHDHDAIMPS